MTRALERVLALLLVAAGASLLGCASSPNGSTSETRVPVFDSSADVPCPYEVMRVIDGESIATTGGSPAAYEQERTRVLGREGARVGADAVLVTPIGAMMGRQAQATQAPGAASAAPGGAGAPTVTFTGTAVRYLPGCTGSTAPNG